ncbi:MAG: electron transfer flavoprotein subunit beta/FixA family protein [Ignavibacteria bacterium]|nr:electron transfer flavoprotein subunit beta/FixA family protein [Ignavibacteria bacterium]
MKILVCISQVPDTAAKIVVSDDGKSINSTGVKYILNPYDEFAIEEGLRLKTQFSGSVTTVNVGPDSGKEILRTALAMGSDAATLIKDDNRTDSYSVAFNIAEYAKELQPDILLFGRQSIDFDSLQLPSMVAELLGMPNISMVSSLTITDSTVAAERDVESGKEIVTTTLPCVISAQKGLNDPRYPKLPDIMKAKSKPIEERSAVTTSARVEIVSMEQPESKRLNKILGDSDGDISELVRLLHEEAKII